MKRKLLTVLYFLNGPVASAADYEAIDKYGQGYTVRQRNALLISDSEALEEFDIVAGAVPANYAAKYAEQGEPVLPETKQISAEGVDPQSPIAPPQDADNGGGGTSEAGPPAKAPEGAEKGAGGAAKPKQPQPKPGAGWKPNA